MAWFFCLFVFLFCFGLVFVFNVKNMVPNVPRLVVAGVCHLFQDAVVAAPLLCVARGASRSPRTLAFLSTDVGISSMKHMPANIPFNAVAEGSKKKFKL